MVAYLDGLTTVRCTVEEGLATVTMARPEKRNAVDVTMHRELRRALAHVRRAEARVLVISGDGAAFSAGQDLTELGQAQADPALRVDDHVRRTWNALITDIMSLRLPVLAAVDGPSAGAGWSIALAADLRIAGASATFRQGFTRIGLVPDSGATWLLPALVGPSRALELMYLGTQLDADTALSWGLVNRVVAAGTALEEAQAMARLLAAMPTRALGMARQAVYRNLREGLASSLEHEAQLQQVAARTADHREGVFAFLEGREPRFTGA